MNRYFLCFRAAALLTAMFANAAAMAQMDLGPKTEKTYGIGLPRDQASQLFKDEDYPDQSGSRPLPAYARGERQIFERWR
jgi:hypothetical protein